MQVSIPYLPLGHVYGGNIPEQYSCHSTYMLSFIVALLSDSFSRPNFFVT
jgi:hypothetical protein